MQDDAARQVQVAYARIAGLVYLLLIVLFMGGEFLISGILGSGDVAGMMERARASQNAYRGALAVEVLTSIFTVWRGVRRDCRDAGQLYTIRN